MHRERIPNPELGEIFKANYIPPHSHEAYEKYKKRPDKIITERQQQILDMSLSGKTLEEIAKDLGISRVTVAKNLEKAKRRKI